MLAAGHAVGNRWRRHGMGADRHADVDRFATFNSVGVTGRNAPQRRLRWARMAEMVAVVASELPPPNEAMPAKPCVSASNCR
jgi:hypothetical protein